MTRPFSWYLVQGHQSRSRSNIKVRVFKKMAIAGALVFHKHNLFHNVFHSSKKIILDMLHVSSANGFNFG